MEENRGNTFIKFSGNPEQAMKADTFDIIFFFWYSFFFFFVVNFVIHWNKTAMGLHVFPIPIPPPTSLSTRSH